MSKTFFINVETAHSEKINEAINLYKEGKRKATYDIYKKLFEDDPNELSTYYSYADLIKEDDASEAFKYVNDGLLIDTNYFPLLKLKADILTNYNAPNLTSTQYLTNLNLAHDYIKKAQEQFELNNKFFKESIRKDEVANPGVAVDLYYSQKMELNTLEANITSLRNSVNVLIRVQQTEQLVIDTEKRLFKERTRLMEILGLFVAIFAFIFSSVQISLHFALVDAISLVTAIGLVLMVFILGLHLAINPEERTRKLIFMFIILVFMLFILPLVPNLISGIKYYLNLQ